jgi:hypothetical protein
VLQGTSIAATPAELVILQQTSPTVPSTSVPLRESQPSSRCFAHLVLQLPSDSSGGSLHVAFAGQPVECATLTGRFAATLTTAHADCECSITCAPAACALFVVYELCLTDVRSALVRSCLAVQIYRSMSMPCCANIYMSVVAAAMNSSVTGVLHCDFAAALVINGCAGKSAAAKRGARI